MQARRSFLVLLFSALLLASPTFSAGGSAPSDEGVSPRCEAAIDKAAGRYSQCLLKASAKYAKSKKNQDRFLAQAAKCEDKWNAQVARAEHRFGEDQCTPYASEIADRTFTYARGAATEASGKKSPSFLFVQDGTGGTLTESTLTLTGVSSKTGYFSESPHRDAGQTSTEELMDSWTENGTFAHLPPNADFTCTVDGEVVNYVVELTSPNLAGDNLTYSAAPVGDTVLPETPVACEADAHLFIDSGCTLKENWWNDCPDGAFSSWTCFGWYWTGGGCVGCAGLPGLPAFYGGGCCPDGMDYCTKNCGGAGESPC